MKATFALLGYAAASTTEFLPNKSLSVQYMEYLQEFGKNYLTQEETEARFIQFSKTHHMILEENQKNQGFELGHNKYSDWTQAEIDALFHTVDLPQVVESTREAKAPGKLPDSLDWSQRVFQLAMVQDQGPCGAGWAFASKGALESASELQQGIPGSYSAQQLIDCAVQHGCSNGDPETAFSYFKQAGVMDDTNYPYNASENQCQYQKENVDQQVKILAAQDIEAHDTHVMKEMLVLQGPLTVVLSANNPKFLHYAKGVFPIAGSEDIKPDHFALAIGYGNEAGKDYLLVRNSFGPFWGENGNIKLEITDHQAACNALYWSTEVLLGF